MKYCKDELIEEHFYNLPDEHKDEWLSSRKNCDSSLFYFIKEIGGSVPKAGGDSKEILFKPICQFWQDDSIKRKFILMPRGWLKTTNLTKWGSVWTYLQDNETRIIVPTEIKERAQQWVEWVGNQILFNERLRWVYPELRAVDLSYKHRHPYSSTRITLPRKGVYVQSTIAAAGIHGSSQGGHYNYIDPDDICGEKAADSTTVMEDACRWFDGIEDLCDTSDPSKPSPSVIRGKGTHQRPGDTYVYIQKTFKEYKWMIVPALKDESLENKDNIYWLQDPEVGHGESNWATRNSTKFYIEMKSNPETKMRFWCQQQNNPGSGSELTKLDVGWLRYYHWEERDEGKFIVCDDDKEVFKFSSVPKYGIIDPGGFSEVKMMKKGSNNAFMIGGQPRDTIKKFVTLISAGKMKEPSKFRAQVYDAHKEQRPQLWKIEVFGQQGYIFKDLNTDDDKPVGFRIFECPKDVGANAKDDRIQALGPVMENGEIYIHRGMKKLIDEVEDYPGGLTCDLIDCLGWLNQLYWSRNPKANLDELNRSNRGSYRINTTGPGY